MSAIGNDYGFENIFKRNLEANANKGDILITLSTSGKSKNIVNVLNFAKNWCLLYSFFGNEGWKM